MTTIFQWFSEIFHVLGFGYRHRGFSVDLWEREETKNKIINFLHAADVGIDDVELEREELPNEFPESLKKEIENSFFSVKTAHFDNNNKKVVFDLADESEGTQKLLALAGLWLDTLEHGYVLAVDELHEHLHPLILRFLVTLFHNSKNGYAQLIFTTHDTSVLDTNVLRRDQIWFCEKIKSQATELVPLTDFRPRKKVENLERGYLSGRYGALPFVGTIDAE